MTKAFAFALANLALVCVTCYPLKFRLACNTFMRDHLVAPFSSA